MVRDCKRNDPSATDEEIAYMLEVKIQQVRESKNINNMPALLAKAVPNMFPSNELQVLRDQKARKREESRDIAKNILADPEASEDDRDWARVTLAE
jgi:hypothetical protein